MTASIEVINERLKDAPQEMLDRLLGYIDALIIEESVPQWQKDLVAERKKIPKENYLSLDSLSEDIRLQK